jgi:hypothetical protein
VYLIPTTSAAASVQGQRALVQHEVPITGAQDRIPENNNNNHDNNNVRKSRVSGLQRARESSCKPVTKILRLLYRIRVFTTRAELKSPSLDANGIGTKTTERFRPRIGDTRVDTIRG